MNLKNCFLILKLKRHSWRFSSKFDSGLAQLGNKVGFIGKVNDDLGQNMKMD